MQTKIGKKRIKVAYVGDEYLEDIVATHEFNEQSDAKWDSILVLNEMDPRESCIQHSTKFWGFSHFYTNQV